MPYPPCDTPTPGHTPRNPTGKWSGVCAKQPLRSMWSNKRLFSTGNKMRVAIEGR